MQRPIFLCNDVIHAIDTSILVQGDLLDQGVDRVIRPEGLGLIDVSSSIEDSESNRVSLQSQGRCLEERRADPFLAVDRVRVVKERHGPVVRRPMKSSCHSCPPSSPTKQRETVPPILD